MDAECATDLLLESIGGDREALDRLIPLVYDELRRIAHRELARARPYQTLATTEVVHEVYLRLVDQGRVARGERIRFLAIAAVAMRRIVIEYARRCRAQKRGGGQRPVSFDEAAVAGENRGEMLIALDEALTRLRALDDRLARVVECRYFGGLTPSTDSLRRGGWWSAVMPRRRSVFSRGIKPCCSRCGTRGKPT
jgi:RNA polymerase sigma factor (TIGR02999 family)